MSASARIDKLCTYFDGEVDAITTLRQVGDVDTEDAGRTIRYRKSLLISTIDTLAGLRFNPGSFPQLSRSNRERFLRFLDEHSSWEERRLVSLPFLADYLEKKGLKTSALAKHIATRMAQFSTEMAGVLRASRLDEPISDLLRLATSEVEETAIAQCHHSAILYRYRNYVVHESRTPGYAMEVFEEPAAHYTGYIGNPQWHLAYPLPMFIGIAKRCIQSFREYLLANDLDPYEAVGDTTRW